MRLLLAASLLNAIVPAPANTSAKTTESEPQSALSAIMLRTQAVDEPSLVEALKLRFPQTPVTRLEERVPDARSPETPFVFVDVSLREATGSYDLTLVVSDGRAYDRVVRPIEGASSQETAQLLARDIANLIVGIEGGALTPDRDDVPIPEPEPPPEEPTEEPVAQTVPPKVEDSPPSQPPPPPPPPWLEVGPRLSLGALIGLGEPGDVDRLAAWSGDAGVHLRFRSGPVIMADLRLAGRGHPSDHSLLRTRIAVGGGYAWRPRGGAPLELEAVGAVTVEPWFVFADGQRTSLDRSEVPAIGGLVRVTPAYRWSRPGGPVSVRAGAFVEFAQSALPGDGGGIAQVSTPGTAALDPMFRIGGSELRFGFDFVVYFAAVKTR